MKGQATQLRDVMLNGDGPRSSLLCLSKIFQRAGYIANGVYSGAEALAFIGARQPSLVISDVIMPGMDGIALAKTIQISCPNYRVLLFSGNADTQGLLDRFRGRCIPK